MVIRREFLRGKEFGVKLCRDYVRFVRFSFAALTQLCRLNFAFAESDAAFGRWEGPAAGRNLRLFKLEVPFSGLFTSNRRHVSRLSKPRKSIFFIDAPLMKVFGSVYTLPSYPGYADFLSVEILDTRIQDRK